MKSSFKNFASFVGVAGLSLSIGLPAIAQTSPSRDSGNGSMSQPSTMMPGMERSGMMGSSYQAAVSVPTNSQSQSIAAIVDESPSFELLNALIRVAAIESPGLAAELSGSGEYTVFAPTDEAFAALPPDAIRALVQPENRDLLIRVLSNHVVPGSISSADIASTEMGRNLSMGSTPPSGEQRPNENVGNVRPENLAPNLGSSDRAGTSDGRQASAPASGEQRPNENTGNVIREDLAPNANEPNRTRDEMAMGQRPEMSSPGGMSSVPQAESGNMSGMSGMSGMNMGGMSGMNMGSDGNQAMEPPSGEQRPNENVGNVQGETLSPRGDRGSMMGGMSGMDMGSSSMMGGMSVSAASVIAPDIQASNGIIHAINRVMLTPELQSEVQTAIDNLDRR